MWTPVGRNWSRGYRVLLRPSPAVEATVRRVACDDAAYWRRNRRIARPLYWSRRRLALTTFSILTFLLVEAVLIAVALIAHNQVVLAAALAYEFAHLGIYAFLGSRIARSKTAILGLTKSLCKVNEQVELVLAKPHELPLRHILASDISAAAKTFLVTYTVRPTLEGPSLRAPYAYRRQWKREARAAAKRLKSYVTLAMASGSGGPERIRDDFARVQLRVLCGSWTEVNKGDLGVEGSSSEVQVSFFRDRRVWATAGTVLVVLASAAAVVQVGQGFTSSK